MNAKLAPVAVLAVVLLLASCGGRQEEERGTNTIPWTTGAPVVAGAARHTLHMNFIMDLSAKCPGTSKCDMPCIPRLNIYFRGDMKVLSSGQVSGEGTMTYADVAPCVTLMPGLSSCTAKRASAGAFWIEGKSLPGGRLQLTLRLRELPQLDAFMTTKHPSGPVSVPFATTCAQLVKNVLVEAGVLETPMEVPSAVTAVQGGSGQPAKLFRGSYEWNGHSIKGLGGLYFIPPDTPVPVLS